MSFYSDISTLRYRDYLVAHPATYDSACDHYLFSFHMMVAAVIQHIKDRLGDFVVREDISSLSGNATDGVECEGSSGGDIELIGERL